MPVDFSLNKIVKSVGANITAMPATETEAANGTHVIDQHNAALDAIQAAINALPSSDGSGSSGTLYLAKPINVSNANNVWNLNGGANLDYIQLDPGELNGSPTFGNIPSGVIWDLKYRNYVLNLNGDVQFRLKAQSGTQGTILVNAQSGKQVRFKLDPDYDQFISGIYYDTGTLTEIEPATLALVITSNTLIIDWTCLSSNELMMKIKNVSNSWG